MRYLLYGIVEAAQAARQPLPEGLAGAPLTAVEEGGLAALLSPVDDAQAASAGLPEAVAFARVVEQLHHRMPVLPMRYGCFVHQPAQAAEFLRRHGPAFADTLAQVAGQEEMGLRLLVPEEAPEAAAPPAPAPPPAATSQGQGQGREYLARRREHYARQARSEHTARQLAEQVQAAFAGLFTRCTWEHAARPGGDMLSMAFLVDRSRLADFREAFQRFEREAPRRAVCSGPWPPYGFVADLARPPLAALAELQHLKEKEG